MIVSTQGNLALYGHFYAGCRYSKQYLGAQLFVAAQRSGFDTLVHSLFDFPLRLYTDLIEKPASLHIEYVLVHRYPPRAGFGGGVL